MAKLGAVMSTPGSSAATRSDRPLAKITRNWDAAAVLLLLVASLPLAWISPRNLIVIQRPGTFDDHWVLDAVYKASHGIYFAKNVAFLYGPLGHWLIALPPRIAGLSLGSIYTSYRTVVLWCAILFTYFALRLLLGEQRAWKRFVLLLVLGVFWTSWDGRTALGLLLFALFLRGWYAVREGRLKAITFACGSALVTTIAFWYSADTGTYGVAAWLLTLGGVCWEARRERQKLKAAMVAVAAYGVSMIALIVLTSAMTSSLRDFHFWRTSLALVSVHRWNEPAAMSEDGAMRLLVPLAIGVVAFLMRFFIRADESVIAARPAFLLSAFVFAVLAMQSGLVRSDSNHIVFGAFPMLFFSGVILFSFRSRLGSAAAAIGVVAASMLVVNPIPEFQPDGLRFRLARTVHPMTTCPSGYREVDHACFPTEFANTLESTAAYIRQHSGDGQAVLIYPYQYMFAVAARRDEAGAVEQTFLANGAYLSKFDIAGMERANALVGLYFRDATPREYRDGILSIPIDDVSNFTRTPEVWFWVLRNYRSDQPIAPGAVGLVRDLGRAASISTKEFALGIAARTYEIEQPDASIDLGAPAWPNADADFLRLRMKVRYGPLWKLRKPERLQLEITRADGSRSLRTFVIEPNVTSDVWFYPWDEADLMRYFDADESRWRGPSRPAITNLRLIVSPFDWFSQPAQSVTVESADAVRVGVSPAEAGSQEKGKVDRHD